MKLSLPRYNPDFKQDIDVRRAQSLSPAHDPIMPASKEAMAALPEQISHEHAEQGDAEPEREEITRDVALTSDKIAEHPPTNAGEHGEDGPESEKESTPLPEPAAHEDTDTHIETSSRGSDPVTKQFHTHARETADTYYIKLIKWQGRKVPILTQNENGPCPLLAICNVLLLLGRLNLNKDAELVTYEYLVGLLGDLIIKAAPAEVEGCLCIVKHFYYLEAGLCWITNIMQTYIFVNFY